MNSKALLHDKYEILSTLADEGTTTTYLAIEQTSQQKVAIKCLSFRQIKDWKVWELFEREATTLKELHHPQIPAYIDFFKVEAEQGVHVYLVHEFVEGRSLAQLLQEGKHFSEYETLNIAIQITEILEYLQNFSPAIIHRDIKPGNIVLTPDNTAFLIDFGAVHDKLMHDQAILGGGSTIVGTYGYMPVEQFHGLALPSSDIYSLGMTLIHLLSKTFPSDIEKKGTLVNFRPHVHVSSQFAAVLQRMIASEHTKRYISATQLLADLRALQAGKPIPKSRSLFNVIGKSLCVLMFAWVAWLVLKLFFPPSEQVPVSGPQQEPESIRTEIESDRIPGTVLEMLIGKSRAHFLAGNEDLEAVVSAIKAGRILQTLAVSDMMRQQMTPTIREIVYGVHEQHRLQGHQGTVACVVFSPDGTILASAGSDDQHIVIWSVPDGKELHRLVGHSKSVWSLAFHPTEHLLASGSFDGTIKLWDVHRGREMLTIPTSLGEVFGVAFSPDGAHVFAGGSAGNGAIKVWDSATGEEVALLQGTSPMVRSLALSPDGILAVGSIFGGQIELWDVKTRQQFPALASGHSKSISHLTFNFDGSLLASGAKDRTIKIWNPTTGQQLLKLSGTPGNVVRFSPDGKLLAVGNGQEGTLSLWHVADGSSIDTFKKQAGTYLYSLDFTPDGSLLASSQDSGIVKIWNVETLAEQNTLHKGTSDTTWTNFKGTLEALQDHHGITIWDLQSSQQLGMLHLPDTSIAEKVITSPDEKWQASLCYGEPITLQNLSTGNRVILDRHVNTINSLQFSPDSMILASGSADRTIRLWNVQEGREIAVLRGHADGVTGVNFNIDGTKLFSISTDNTIKIWELDLNAILQQGCNWIRGYLQNNSQVNAEDHEICNDI